jgi:hypothetical protein
MFLQDIQDVVAHTNLCRTSIGQLGVGTLKEFKEPPTYRYYLGATTEIPLPSKGLLTDILIRVLKQFDPLARV